ncbi:hypothetical protein POM88_017176 [Heracleum sosnowskyi]|uniref:FH2 domain-containing protein n=1 Tax=Heracleum sosnowskyi TaxID=360622 RepID=A0AAD8MZ52_9APIA|nr:hypothetical protein POM88_017176 [Heracleum sosnowskyi]
MRYSNKVSSETSDDSSNNSQMNIAVIAACSVAAIAVIALFFFCCLRGSSNISPGPAKDFSTLSNVNSFSVKPAKPATQVPGPPVTKATEPTSPVRGDPRPPSANNPAAPPPPPKIGHPTPPNPPRLAILLDKVLADPEHSMVWNEIKTGSFQFDEKMMEDLFGYNNNKEKNNEIISKRNQASFESTQFVQILDAKKSQNLSILLKAINVTTKEVCDAIQEGNSFYSNFFSQKEDID